MFIIFHYRGVLDIAWCGQDSDLLLSCGKDNRILCWNPNSNVPGGEVCNITSLTSILTTMVAEIYIFVGKS